MNGLPRCPSLHPSAEGGMNREVRVVFSPEEDTPCAGDRATRRQGPPRVGPSSRSALARNPPSCYGEGVHPSAGERDPHSMALTLDQYASYLDTRDLSWPAAPDVERPRAKPHLSRRVKGIRAVLWNVYGTLLNISGGDLLF